MEGVSAEHNEICLEVTPENLSRALKTVHHAKSVKVKLTKKHRPCLTIAGELVRRMPVAASLLLSNDIPAEAKSVAPPPPAVQPTLSSTNRIVTHDVPVDVIPRKLWHEFKEPAVPDFEVSGAAEKRLF